MSKGVFQATIADSQGNIQPFASVAVRDHLGNLVSLYSDVDGTPSPGNPKIADASGFVRFYADPFTRLSITATKGGFTRNWADVVLVAHDDIDNVTYQFNNLRLECFKDGSNNLVFSVVTRAGATPSASSPVTGMFRSQTLTTGALLAVDITSALTLTVPAAAALGISDSANGNIHPVLCYDGSAVQLGVITDFKKSNYYSVVNTTAVDNNSDSGTVLYTTSAMTNSAVIPIGVVNVTRGTNAWSNSPTYVRTIGDPESSVALTGDVTGSGVGTIAATIPNDTVTFAKMQNIATDRMIGRDTASSGDPEEISVGGGLEFTGSAGIQRSALSGDVTASAGSNSTTIANDAVTNAKLANMAEARVKGRSAGSGTGDPEDLTDHQLCEILGGGVYVATQIITQGTTSFTVSDNTTRIHYRMVGGGGGGGGAAGVTSQAGVGSGGGAGMYIEGWLDVDPGQTYSCSVGANGTGGTAGANGGTSGGATSITIGATVVTAVGGEGGDGGASGTSLAFTAQSGNSGTGISQLGDINIIGQSSRPAIRLSGTVAASSAGADSPLGNGGMGRDSAGSASGTGFSASQGYGGGGGGAMALTNTNRAGGDGADGVIIIDEFTFVSGT